MEYDPRTVDQFIQLADGIEARPGATRPREVAPDATRPLQEAFNDVQVEGIESTRCDALHRRRAANRLTLRLCREGAFEVTGHSLNGLHLFSRLQSARPPTIEEVIAAIKSKMPAAGTLLSGESAGGACA